MKFLLAAIATGATICVASAADVAPRPFQKAPPLPVYDWTGFYLGANIGIGVGRSLTTSAIPNTPPALGTFMTPSLHLGDSGVIGGGQIGYNVQWGVMLFGIEADLQAASLRDQSCTLHCDPLTSNVTQYDHKLGWFGTVRGRVGLVDGPVASYFTGGFAYGDATMSVTNTFGLATGSLSVDETRTGWTIGSGVEAALGGNWTVKIEYLYLDLGTLTGSSPFVSAGFGTLGTQTVSSDIREHIFRAGLNYRIGGAAIYAPAPVPNWSGFYFGGNAGSATALNQSVLASTGSPIPPIDWAERFNVSPRGYFGGAQVGFNWQSGSWVFGIETDIQGSGQKDDDTCTQICVFAAPFLASTSLDQRMPWFATLRGRVGYSVGPALFYATGGFAYGEIETRFTDVSIFPPNPVVSGTFSHKQSGYAVGAGIETPFRWLGPNYVDLGSVTDTYTNAPETRTFTTDISNHIFRAGLNYHFNQPVAARF